MKPIFSLSLFILLLTGNKILSQSLFDKNSVQEINIQFWDSDWDAILDSLIANDYSSKLLAQVSINGTLFDSCGVKYKGNSSYSPSRIKNPLNIELDYIINGQDYQGSKHLKLGNIFKDPSCVREVLAYELLNHYMPASKANYANVHINGIPIGLYTNIQDVDGEYLDFYYCGDKGDLFKGDNPLSPAPPAGCPPWVNNRIWAYPGSDSTCYTIYTKEQGSFQQLIELFDTFNNYQPQVNQVFNMDRHLWMLAFDILCVNLDAPVNTVRNYYLYSDERGIAHHIPWDLNESFGAFTMLTGPGGGPLSTSQMQNLDPYTHATGIDFPILSNPLNNDRFKRMYVAHMKTMMEEIISSDWYLNRAGELQDLIDAYVLADGNKFYSYTDFQNNVSVTAPPTAGIVGISELMDARNTYLAGLLDFTNSSPGISDPSCIYNEDLNRFEISCRSTDPVYIQLSYRFCVNEPFQYLEMFDDGLHSDGAASDGVYGNSINCEFGSIQYCFYAENDLAGVFSPARAENEFYRAAVPGSIVINEVVAANATIQADAQGDFDDYVELYNNGSSVIYLENYTLSDDDANPAKWTFPAVSLAAGDYLIIWCDEDTLDSPGLHANFKLNKCCEALTLSDAGGQILDQICFPFLEDDSSYSRLSNGIGGFVIQSASFSANNGNEVNGITEKYSDEGFSIFPNPATQSVKLTARSPISRIEISTLQGQIVMLRTQNPDFHATLDLTALPLGVYFIRIDSSKLPLRLIKL